MNNGLQGFPRNNKNIGMNGFPKKRALNTSFYGFPAKNIDSYDLQIQTVVDNKTISFVLNGIEGAQYIINFGDGTENSIGTFVTADRTITHTYAVAGVYNLVFISGVKDLTKIVFDSNNVCLKKIPSIWDDWENLTYLDLVSQSYLEGELLSVNGLINIETFYIRNCQNFGRYIPDFSNCAKLSTLKLYSCKFIGELPSFNNNVNLFEFHIYNNAGLIGTLPSFSNCALLTDFQIYGCGFIGILPSFATCTLLTTFYIQANQFSGNLPTFETCILLTYFNCEANQFTGSVPNFNTCTELRSFNIRQTRFTDINLSGFTNLINLTSLLISQCRFTSTFPDLSNNTNLQTLYFGGEGAFYQWTGTFPNLSMLTKLVYVSCQYSNLEGTLPSFSACPDLVAVFITNGKLSGVIPSFYNCKKLNNLQLHTQQWFTEIESPFLDPITPLNDFWLAGNKIVDTILDIPLNNYLRVHLGGGNSLTGEFPSIMLADLTGNAYGLYADYNSFTSFQNFITNIYNTRTTRTFPKSIVINGPNNAVPSGFYQAPSGYVQANLSTAGNDGTPVTEKEMIYVLVNQNMDFTDVKKYKYTFTTN